MGTARGAQRSIDRIQVVHSVGWPFFVFPVVKDLARLTSPRIPRHPNSHLTGFSAAELCSDAALGWSPTDVRLAIRTAPWYGVVGSNR